MSRTVPGTTVLRRSLRRLALDPHVLLAVAISVSALIIVLVDGSPRNVVAPIVLFLVAQVAITLLVAGGRRTEALDTITFLAAAHTYTELVEGMGWTPARYETWLADALYQVLFAP